MEMSLSVAFPSAALSTIAFHSLRVDGEPQRSGVRKTLAVNGPILRATFAARDARALRVSVNGFLDHLVLVTETIRRFGGEGERAQ